jgi:hypothetical protein
VTRPSKTSCASSTARASATTVSHHAALTGYVLAATVATALSSRTALPIPGWQYFASTGTGLAVSLAVLMTTLPLLDRITRTQNARFE